MPNIDISADASKGVDELAKYGAALAGITDRIDKLNSVTANFNRFGDLVGATVKSSTGAFESLTQVVNKSGTVIRSYYEKNEDAARKAAVAAEKAAAAEQARLDKQVSAFGAAFNRIGRIVTGTITSSITNTINRDLQDSIKSAKDFQVQLSLIRTIQQGPGQQSFAKTGRDVRSVSDATGFDIKDVGKAFYDATSNQVAKGADTAGFVKQAADLARVTGSQLPDTVNLLSTALNSYGLSAADAEKVSAIFFKTIDEGRVIASEMANTLGRLYPLADQVGVSMTEVNAVIAITTQKGVKTNDAITLMSNLLVKLEKPTAATAEFFKSLGVDSGEAAIQLYGFTGLIQKMVDAVNSGQVPVSAFFDEIRGRKQFAVFQQSIGQIDEFNKKLKDTSTIVSEYRGAQAIRSESPADSLNKEANKLSNVFKVELGQAVVTNLDALQKWVGGVEGVRNAVGGFENVLIGTGVVVGTYTATTLIAAAGNTGFAATFNALKVAAIGARLAFAPLGAAFASFYLARKYLFDPGEANKFGIVDNKAIDTSVDALERYRQANTKKSTVDSPYASFDKQKESVETAYKSALRSIADANIANNKFLDEAKTKSKEAADAIKVSFGTYTDTFKNKISDIKKLITDATEEIKRSKKSVESFGDRGQEALYQFREKYANDDFGNQKTLIGEQRVADLRKRAQAEYVKGTDESIAEGRKLYDTLISEEVKLEETRVEHRKKQLEADQQAHPENYQRPGSNILLVDDTNIRNKIASITAEQAVNEEKIQTSKQKQIESNKQLIVTAEVQLRTLEQALKKYESIDVFTKEGAIKAEYKTGGKFDKSKLDADLAKSEENILKSATDPNQQFQLLIQLSQRRQALAKEAGAAERSETLKTLETRIGSEKEAQDKKIEDAKKTQIELQKLQEQQLGGFLNKQTEIQAFSNQIAEVGTGANIRNDPKQLARLTPAFEEYRNAVDELQKKKITRGGIEVLDPELIDRAVASYNNALTVIRAVKNSFVDRNGNPLAGDLKLADSNGRSLDIQEGRQSTEQLAKEAKSTSIKLLSNSTENRNDAKVFEEGLGKQLNSLKDQFPDLATEGKKATDSLDQNFKSLSTGGIQQLKQELKEIQSLLPKAGDVVPGGAGKGRTSLLSPDDADGNVAYAATGGIVGQFPGQARGVDQYPIWAAAGERIISAETSAMYAPMLDAIMQRRAPRYMAEGGVVGRTSGGTTNIGDININVNGASTNSETARVIGQRLERQLKQNNIRLEPRRVT